MADIVDIKQVPPSPGTTLEPTKLYNPLNEDFVWTWDGKHYTVPAKSITSFPEFLARHLAKHLARKIVYSRAYKEIEEKAKGQLTPDTAKAVPDIRVARMIEWLLNPVDESPEKEITQPIKEQSETKLEDMLTKGERKALETYRKRVANAQKARATKKQE